MFHLGKKFIILIICGCVFLLLLIIGIIYFLNRPKLINTFVAVGEGTDTIAWSDDGKNWNKIAGSGFNPPGIGRGTCVASNGNVWVAGGQEPDTLKNMVFSTDNGRTWTPVTPPTPVQSVLNNNNIVNGVVWNGTNFIAVGEGFNGNTTAVWSENGKIWNSSSGKYVIGDNVSCLSLNSLACNETICVAVSEGPKAVIIYSDDSGHSWNEGTGATFSDNSVGSFVAVNDDNNWVAISKNSKGTNILFSSDGKYWKIPTPTTNIFTGSDSDSTCELYCVAHDNGSNWVVVGNKGIGYSSDNGLNWVITKIIEPYFSVVYNGKIWVASGYKSILYSSNGLSWTKSDTTNSEFENHLCWNGTVWVLGGYQSPAIRWSEDVTKPWNTTDTVFLNFDGKNEGAVHGIACRYKI